MRERRGTEAAVLVCLDREGAFGLDTHGKLGRRSPVSCAAERWRHLRGVDLMQASLVGSSSVRGPTTWSLQHFYLRHSRRAASRCALLVEGRPNMQPPHEAAPENCGFSMI